MTQLKKHIAYTFLAVFVCTAIIGIFGAIGVISIPATPLVTIFAFLAAQCITVIAAIIKAPNYFDDPLVVTELKERHEGELRQLLAQERQEALKQHQIDQDIIAGLQEKIKQLTAQSEAATITYLNEKR